MPCCPRSTGSAMPTRVIRCRRSCAWSPNRSGSSSRTSRSSMRTGSSRPARTGSCRTSAISSATRCSMTPASRRVRTRPASGCASGSSFRAGTSPTRSTPAGGRARSPCSPNSPGMSPAGPRTRSSSSGSSAGPRTCTLRSSTARASTACASATRSPRSPRRPDHAGGSALAQSGHRRRCPAHRRHAPAPGLAPRARRHGRPARCLCHGLRRRTV